MIQKYFYQQFRLECYHPYFISLLAKLVIVVKIVMRLSITIVEGCISPKDAKT